ncbi:hypothetical protein [Bdellovibrio reynosensis]|uniref:Uncharacterized protein n=1 Tax=Bdellovibrio reynosensis TaxID=2835041 RepID=A0ABY4CFG5_9BACT|nr:hypothetical protein [Bdellovibrio reynosensis]UOF02627.1 hypothetical protein MNR06_06650 [Bdellovibrio reynosensis]
MKNSISLLLVTSLALSGCSNSTTSPKVKTEIKVQGETELKKLISGPQPNLALAEIAAQEVKLLNPEVATQLAKQMEGSVNWAELQKSTTHKILKTAQGFVMGASPAVYDPEYMSRSLIRQIEEARAAGSFAGRIEIQVANMAKSEALKGLMATYNETLNSQGKEISAELVERWSKEQPEIIQQIDSLISVDVKNRAAEITKVLKQADRLLVTYGIPDEDQAKILLYGLIANHLHEVLKEHKTVKELIRIVGEVNDAKAKIQNVLLLADSLSKHGQALKNDWKNIKSSFSNIVEDLKYYEGLTDPDQMVVSEEARKGVIRYLDDVLNGKVNSGEKASSEKKSFLTEAHPIDKNVDSFLTSTKNASDSLSNLINITEQLSGALGVRIDPSLVDAMNTAKKVTAGVELVHGAVKAYATGGLVGALGVISGGAGGVLGIGGAPSELGMVKQDLAEIKKTQMEILKIQKATVRMIKDLAVMIDEYHQQELRALAEIRDDIITNLELNALTLNRDIHLCHALLSYAYSSSSPVGVRKSLVSVREASLNRQLFLTKIGGLKGIRDALSSSQGSYAQSCHHAMSLAFKQEFISDTPLLLRHINRFQDGEKESGIKIQSKLYTPALNYFHGKISKKDFEEMSLHLPVLDFKTYQSRKIDHIYSKATVNREPNLLSLVDLVGPLSLERYGTLLVALHPYISTNIRDFENLETLTDEKEGMENGTKWSQQWLAGALEITKIAIAQESILAGEPLLHALELDWPSITAETSDCVKEKKKFCFVRQNPLMLRNLLTYIISRKNGFSNVNYSSAYEKGSSGTNDIANLLNVKPDRLIFENSSKRWILKLDNQDQLGLQIYLPTPEVVARGRIEYSEAMPRLLMLQEKIAEELALVTPLNLNEKETNEMMKLLIIKN